MVFLEFQLSFWGRPVWLILTLLAHVLLTQSNCACESNLIVTFELTVVIHEVRINIDRGGHCHWLALIGLLLRHARQRIFIFSYRCVFYAVPKIRNCRGLHDRVPRLLYCLRDGFLLHLPHLLISCLEFSTWRRLLLSIASLCAIQ